MANPTPTEPKPEREQPPPAAPVTPSAPSRWTGRRIAAIVGGSLLALIALGLMACGAYGLWLHTTQRSDGYVMTSSERFSTASYALATRTLHISSDVPSFLYGRDWLGDVRIRGQSANPNSPLFMGIARKDEVDRYLAGVAHWRWWTSARTRSARPTGRATAPSPAASPRFLQTARRSGWPALRAAAASR